MEHIARKDAFELLKKYNKDPFHIQHALTVEAVMKWYANDTTKYSKWLYSFLHKNRINGFSAQNIRLQNGL